MILGVYAMNFARFKGKSKDKTLCFDKGCMKNAGWRKKIPEIKIWPTKQVEIPASLQRGIIHLTANYMAFSICSLVQPV